MAFELNCPHCRGRLSVNDEWVGTEVQCPTCERDFVVSEPAARKRPKPVVSLGGSVSCPHCGEGVLATASVCRRCGELLDGDGGWSQPVPRPHAASASTGRRSALNVVLGVVLCLGVLAVLPEFLKIHDEESGSGKRHGSERPIVTLEKYHRVATGMTYQAVATRIIGNWGEELSRSNVKGVPGVMPSLETVMYQWVNPDGSNMNAMFQNNRLVQKAQFGLK